MDQKLLHKFMAGHATDSEGMEIMEWYEASEANREQFLRERRIFDALLLHGCDNGGRRGKVLPGLIRRFVMTAVRVAAMVAIAVLAGLSYHLFRGEEQVLMSVVSVPAGQRADIILPDGSKVCLNALSTLSYPTTFSNGSREVNLSGQAYFDVTHDEKAPFTVHAGHYDVRVLGTQFDVEAYQGTDDFCTTLISGSVLVSKGAEGAGAEKVILKPNEKAYLSDGRLAVAEVEDMSSLRWREGLVCFNKETFPNIMKQFEKYYGVKIEISPTVNRTDTYTGKFRQSDGLDYALRVLQRDMGFEFERDEDEPVYLIH